MFNNKLYCPHHGCAFNIITGTVEYGPSYFNLPKFHVEDSSGKIKIFYPQKMPKKILPKI